MVPSSDWPGDHVLCCYMSLPAGKRLTDGAGLRRRYSGWPWDCRKESNTLGFCKTVQGHPILLQLAVNTVQMIQWTLIVSIAKKKQLPDTAGPTHSQCHFAPENVTALPYHEMFRRKPCLLSLYNLNDQFSLVSASGKIVHSLCILVTFHR